MRFDNKVIWICWDHELTLGLQGICKLLKVATLQYCIPWFKLRSVPFPLENKCREFVDTWDFWIETREEEYVGTGWGFVENLKNRLEWSKRTSWFGENEYNCIELYWNHKVKFQSQLEIYLIISNRTETNGFPTSKFCIYGCTIPTDSPSFPIFHPCGPSCFFFSEVHPVFRVSSTYPWCMA